MAFLQALDISCYSFVAVAQRAVPMMRPGGSLLTLTYVGAERWTPHYNVMGWRRRRWRRRCATCGRSRRTGHPGECDQRGPDPHRCVGRDWRFPLHPALEPTELADAAECDYRGCGRRWVYLLSDLSAGVTGEVHHVDCGYHIVGMKNPAAPDIAIIEG